MDLAQTRISDSVIVFDGNYPGGGNVTSTVVQSAGQAFVFDSLLYPDDTRKLLSGIKNLNLSIKGLVNTHWHVDHTAGNQLFFETKRIISHSLCADLMRKDSHDWINEELKEEDKIKPAYPNEEIWNGSVLSIGESELEFLHTPGHTPDSIVGWLREEKVVIAGDTVMELPFFGYGNSEALIESLRKVQSISRGAKIIQGHGGICDSDKLDGDLSYIAETTRRAAECLASGKTVEQASSDIKLEDCVSKERFQFLTEGFESILWCHPENVRTVCTELELRTK